MTLKRISAPDGVAPATRYSHVVTGSGRFVAVAGQVALNEKGELVGPEDPQAQARQVLMNVQRCLEAAGASFADVVKMTYFFTEAEVLQAVRDAWDELLPDADRPASTAVQVVALFQPGFMLEAEAFAVVTP